MTFVPSSSWAIAYALTLLVSSLLVWRGGSDNARRVMSLVAIHWLSWRVLGTVAYDTAWPWLLHDLAMIAGLVVYGRCQLAYAAAAAYVVAFAFDQWWFFFGARPESTAAVLEAVGYLTMIMATGAAHGPDRGKPNRFGRRIRRAFGAVDFAPGRTSFRRAGMPASSVGVSVSLFSQDRGA